MRHHLLVATVASAGLFLATACSSTEAVEPLATSIPASPQVTESSDPRAGAPVAAKIVDTDFAPVTIRIEPGATIRWKQIGDQPHSVTAADGSFDSSPDCGPLDSDRCLGMGDTFVHDFDTPGTFVYYCRVHGLPDGTGMVGTVVVE